MFQKFIINRDGVLKFGRVYLHRDMLAPGEQCTYGGGLWKIDEGRGASCSTEEVSTSVLPISTL